MPLPRGDQRHVVAVAQANRLLILLAAAGVDDGGDAGGDEEIGGVGEGEEGVGAGAASRELRGVAVFLGEFDGDFGGHGGTSGRRQRRGVGRACRWRWRWI